MSQSSDDTRNAQSGSIDLGESERHALLASERRRLVLDVVGGRTDTIDIDDLAAGVVARERGVDAADVEQVDDVKIELHHAHLPKLADHGVIDYNPESGQIDPHGYEFEF